MKRRWSYILLALLMTIMGTGSFPDQAAAKETILPHELKQAADSAVEKAMARESIPGVAVVITLQDRIIFQKGYGFADVEHGVPMDPERTILPVGSLSKSLTATAIMQLEEQGKVSLDQDVNRYLSSFHVPMFKQQPITLHHLLTHTAGLDDAMYGVEATSPSKAVELKAFMKHYFDEQPPVRLPGEAFAYNNANYGLIASLLEDVSGKPIDDYMSRYIFEPLDMPSAGISAPLSPDMARSYTFEDGSYVPLPHSYVNMPGAGGVSMVPVEWAHYMIAQLNDGMFRGKRLLHADTVRRMQARHFAEHPDLEGVGYGFFRTRLRSGLLTLSHTGDINGFSAKMVLVPSRKLGIFVISNAPSQGGKLHDSVISSIVQLLPEARQELHVNPALFSSPLQQYARTYTLTLGPLHGWGKWLRWLGTRDYEVSASENHLVIHGIFPDGPGEKESRIYEPIGTGLFREQESDNTVSFQQVRDEWNMSFTQGVTLVEKPPWWRHPAASLAIYVTITASWVLLFVIGLVRCLLCAISPKRFGHTFACPSTWIAAIFTCYLSGQLLYGNSEVMIQGYPLWYIWCFSALPFIGLVRALYVAIMKLRPLKPHIRKRIVPSLPSCLIACLSLLTVAFLFYWNMLPIHFT